MLCETGVGRARELLIGWDRVALRSSNCIFLKSQIDANRNITVHPE
jgi:hypothetical protein